MKLAVYSQSGEKVKDITLSPAFDMKVSPKTVTLYINYLRAALRSPIANTKDRGAVSGGGRKPYKQKGTGNARAGSNRSPLWVGGGVTFGPSNERNFKIRINGKEKKRAILGIMAELIGDKKVKVVDDMTLPEIKTKTALSLIEKMQAEGKVAIIVEPSDTNAILSFRNIAGVHVMTPNKLDVLNLISINTAIISEKALVKFEENYSIKTKSESSPKAQNSKAKTEPAEIIEKATKTTAKKNVKKEAEKVAKPATKKATKKEVTNE